MADDEILDYIDADGCRLGSATRQAIHRQGLWHRTLHLWLASREGDGALLYQLRASSVRDWPGLLDATVAGHLLAGESYIDGLREAREEIGIAVPGDAAIAVGIRREVGAPSSSGVNRELQGVHIACLDPAWGTFEAADHEAAGLFFIANADGIALHRGETHEIACEALIMVGDAVRRERRTVTSADFVPRGDYYLRIHQIAAALLAGRSLPPLDR